MSEHASLGLSIGEAIVSNLLEAARPQIPALHGRSWQALTSAIRAHAATLAEQNAARATDGPSQQWLALSSLLLAAYRELQPLVGDAQEVLAILRHAMAAPIQARIATHLEERFGITQETPADAFTLIAANFKRRGDERFGDAFTYVQDVQDETRSFINIERCFFNDFIRANGAPEVTPIFCAMDYLWADELEQPRYGVRFDRPTTLAQGHDACRFQFTKNPSVR
jgi:hypothetical protein